MAAKNPEQNPTKGRGLVQIGKTDLENERDLPPVVARMVIEIRSDGTRTVARGALEDLKSGERVDIRAGAETPLALARELSKTLMTMPVLAGDLARQAAKEILPDALARGKAKWTALSKATGLLGRKKS